MKIVHLLPALTKGGGERIAVDLANHAAKSGDQVTVVAAYEVDPGLLRNSLHESVEVRYISRDRHGRVRHYLNGLIWLSRNRAWLAEQDILHCHLTYASVIGTLVRLLRTPRHAGRPAVIETYHGVGMAFPAAIRWLHSRLATQRDALVLMAVDDYWQRFAERRPKLLCQVIANGVAVPEGSVGEQERLAYRRQIGIPDDCERIVGTVGQLRPDRQPWLHLPIFADIARALGPSCHFVIAGDGPEFGRLKELVRKSGLEERIHLPGLVQSARLPVSIMDLYVTLNVGQITGIAALEAAFERKPIVAIQLLKDYKPAASDWIWSSSDPAEVAAHAIALLKSPERLAALAARQQDHVRANHVVDVMADAYRALYRRAIERGQPDPPAGNPDAHQ